ncbi:MAG TPA: DUF4411 family protein [Candidatus Nitrosocosmicus sp.]|nr:DUF4411 family protein [Candidatus Nitrosocosmicus sp.]
MAGLQLSLYKKYCIDSSALIDVWDENEYPSSVYLNIRSKFEVGFQNGLFIAPMEVFRELKKQQDDLSKLVTQHKSHFIEVDSSQSVYIKQIYTKYTAMSLLMKTEADPFVVALARAQDLTVVCNEKRQIPPSLNRPKIPNLCDEFGVKCLSLNEFFQEVGWKFSG